MMNEMDKYQDFFEKDSLWSHNDNSVWLASTISLMRNIEKYKFPGKLSADRRQQIVALVSKEMQNLEPFQQGLFIRAEELTSQQKEFLMEHFLTYQSFQQAHAGEAFLLDQNGDFAAIFNLRNHIHLELIDIKGDLENSWNRLVHFETALGKAINYSYSSKFGYLTADPYQCGTALQVVVFLQPSALIHLEKIDDLLEKLADESYAITGIQGSPTDIIGDVLAVQNNYTLGLTEENIVSSLRTFTTKLLVEERAARAMLRQEQNVLIKDKVSRAYGILVHSYQIDAVEALNAISLLKLGLDLGWLKGLTNQALNQMFFDSRRAHLMSRFQEKIVQEEILHKRAEFIHQTLKDVQLTI
jgi:protein arginine kinase